MLLALSLVFSAQVQAAAARTVLATVLNSRNQPMVDVEVDDFVVRESGQPREVLSVHIADYPIALLIDNTHEEVERALLRCAVFVLLTGVAIGR